MPGTSSARGDDHHRSSRGLRSDAASNRERILAAAAAAVRREGVKVPMATIAADAGVGIATLYRRYPQREHLLRDLTDRAYRIVLDAAESAAASPAPAIDAVAGFLAQMIARRTDLTLPLVGGPVPTDSRSVAVRAQIDVALSRVVARGREDGTVRGDASGLDIVITASLLAQPLANAPDWDAIAGRQAQLYLDGLRHGASPLPAPAVTMVALEAAFARTAAAERRT